DGEKYFVQVKAGSNFSVKNGPFVTATAGLPGPSICKIDPDNGPKGIGVKVYGDYLSDASVYFWAKGATIGTITGRIKAIVSTYDNGLKSITLNLPAGVETGPVTASSSKMGNQVQFTVNNCLVDTKCVGTEHCCASGSQAGVCKAANDKCEGEILSTGYVWRFSTKDIPVKLHVVERCDSQTELGKGGFPSPSPSVLWNIPGVVPDHTKVCRGATTLIEFSRSDVGPIKANDLVVQECKPGENSDLKTTSCTVVATVPVQDQGNAVGSYFVGTASNENSYLELKPTSAYYGGQWRDNTWYRVVLSKNITAGTGTSTEPLFVDRPCDVTNSAYCFVFKTGQEDCKIKAVVVAPYSYWTKILEAPMKKHSANSVENLYYSGHGLSTQRCIMMNPSGFSWNWNSSRKDYSDIVSGGDTQDKVAVSALQNTVGVGLVNPTDALDIQAIATKNSKSYSGTSTLTIDLSNPEVVSYEPNCLEACTNAQIAVKFNVSMSSKNLYSETNSIKLLKCADENCLSTKQIDLKQNKFIDENTGNTYIQITPSSSLEKESLYQVTVSASSTLPPKTPEYNTNVLWSAAKSDDPASYGKPYNKQFTWRFRTKKEACQIDRVEVSPQQYFASSLFDRTVYTASMFSAPDACSVVGQKLDPKTVGWIWDSVDKKVATTTSFTTIGTNPYCTASCIRKGSDISAVSSTLISNFPVCGNGKKEAGEDCDTPDASKGCGLNCLYMGNTVENGCGNGIVQNDKGEECDPANADTKIGCSAKCLHIGSQLSTGANDVNASICGNSMLGKGEDCDLGISANSLSPSSSMYCTANCLHQGTRLSTEWCNDHNSSKSGATKFGGFTTSSYDFYCNQAYSQCGDGVQNPDEDPGCDSGKGWASDFCNEYCLFKKGITVGDITDDQCDLTKPSEGCSEVNKQHIGSSLLYSVPSVCGDGMVGIGEDQACEEESGGFVINKSSSFVNPWVLAIGVGQGIPSGTPLSQKTDIKADINKDTNNGKTKGSSGKFLIECGYVTDSDCVAGFGVANDTCCYARTHLTSVFPGATTTDGSYPGSIPASSSNVCPNTTIEAHFNGVISQPSLNGNLFLARHVNGTCGTALDVTDKVKLAFGGFEDVNWYQKIWQKFVKFVAGIFGNDASAGADVWCAFSGAGSAIVIPDAIGTGSKISVGLNEPLTFNTDFVMVLGSNIKDTRGVRIGDVKVTSDGTTKKQSIFWRFKTGNQICAIDSLTVTPDQYVFSRPGVTTTLYAVGQTASGQSIQGIPSYYDWNIAWGPYANDYVYLTSTSLKSNLITSQNHDGEIDVRASANITANQYTPQKGLVATGRSHIIVFLCENPWPPKDLLLDNGEYKMIFPYDDKVGNNDGFNTTTNKFDNTSIPDSKIGTGYFNFSTYYCADNGSTGTYDDLPYMKPAVQVGDNIVSISSTLKQFLFTGDKTYDSSGIAIKIFPNTEHLSLNQWLKNSQEFGGQNFANIAVQNLKVDGYNAVSDGNNIYVDALNFNFDGPPKGKLFSNIYLFSISDPASAETRAVFDQMIKNLRFNANLTNYGYCGASMDNPGVDFKCTTDFDCANGQMCSVQTDKLKRDYLRLQDLGTIEKSLINYNTQNKKYPDMSAGSYLVGQTVSTWSSSWGSLGTTLGAGALPVDQINRLGPAGTCASTTNKFCLDNAGCTAPDTCLLHSPVDGWSTENDRYSFACNTSSLAYRYIFTSTTAGYTVRGRYESITSNIDNWSTDFVKKFIQTPGKFDMSDGQGGTGICLQNEEVSTMKKKGICGDGEINLDIGEVCDTKKINIDYGPTGPVCKNNIIEFKICKSDCSDWTTSTTPCSALSKCGNDEQEPGEFCDDGELNGTYNHCDAKNLGGCQSYGLDTNSGMCGDNELQSKYEFCDNSVGGGLAKCSFASSTGITEQFAEVPIFYFLIDLSGSMLWDFDGCMSNGVLANTGTACTFDNKTRFKYVQDELPLVAEKLFNKIKIGIATFQGSNSNPSINEILPVGIYTKDQITKEINKLKPDNATPTGFGIKKVREDYLQNLGLDDYLVSKNLVLVTDGDENANIAVPDQAITQITKLKTDDSVLTYVLAIATKSNNFESWAVAGGTSPYTSVKGSTSLADKINQFYLSKPCKPYSFTKNYSCKWDCSGFGSYCGDGVIDGPGESCEANEVCSVDGVEGVRQCNSCQKQNSVAIGNWDFNSIYAFSGQNKYKDSVNTHNLSCDKSTCPTEVAGIHNKAAEFSFADHDYLFSSANSKLNSDQFTVSAWINPS
ncbi:MAG: VWA domain-containing protein, partial [bacterium]|nr:VWA domain-containing protein [bacterium]